MRLTAGNNKCFVLDYHGVYGVSEPRDAAIFE